MQKAQTADILIIGGGVIGLSIAYQLGKRGASVSVLDAGYPGQASSAAAGMLAPLAEAAQPGPLLGLTLESLRRYPQFLESLSENSGTEIDTFGPGMLRVARTESEEAALCRAASWQEALGLPLHKMTGAEARRLEPALSRDICSAVLSPQETHIEPRRLIQALQAACHRYDVQFSASATNTSVSSDKIIYAGGAWTALLCPTLPIRPLRGQILALGPASPAHLRHTIYTHGTYIVPRADGRLIVGATEESVGYDCQTTEEGIHSLRSGACALVPTLNALPIQSAWAGLRPVSADGLPLLGRIPGSDNAYVAAGHGRNGILLTPITGQIMADLILDGIAPPPAFDPARFGGAV